MTLKIRTINATPQYDLQEAKLITIGKKPSSRALTRDDIIKDIISEHSFLEFIHFNIRLDETDKDSRNQLVRHTKHHPRFACQSSRPDWTGIERDNKNLISWLGQWNILAIIRMMNQRLCTKTEMETYKIAVKIKKMLMESDDIFQQAVGYCCVPQCIHRAGCPTGKHCGVFNSDKYFIDIPERLAVFNEEMV